MSDESIKVSGLAQAANVASTDRVIVLRDPTGTPSLRTVPFSTLSANLVLATSTPANSSANGVTGTIRFDSSYVYVCIANNSWGRVALETTW